MERAALLAGAREERMFPYRRILLLALAVLVGAALLCGVLQRMATSVHRRARAVAVPSAARALSSPDGPVPPAIRTTIHKGLLAVTLRVTPVDVGPVRFVATVTERARRVTDGQVRIQLTMPAQPGFGRALLETVPCAAGYCAQGTFQALGRWRVDVLVRLPDRSGGPLRVPFDVLNGANARFLFAQPPDARFGPATVRLARVADGSSVLQVRLHPHLAVRAVVAMPNMRSMGTAIYPASARPQGWYGVTLAFPMAGVTQVVLEVRTRRGWYPVRTLLYDVGSSGQATLLTNTPS